MNFCLGTWNSTSEEFESQSLTQASSNTTLSVPTNSIAYLVYQSTGPTQDPLWVVSLYATSGSSGTLNVQAGSFYYVKSDLSNPWIYVLDASDLSPIFYLIDVSGDNQKAEAQLLKSAFEYTNPE